ncbi:MAG: hypothetical protein AAFU73_18065 [Planctomycetota bacterium]
MHGDAVGPIVPLEPTEHVVLVTPEWFELAAAVDDDPKVPGRPQAASARNATQVVAAAQQVDGTVNIDLIPLHRAARGRAQPTPNPGPRLQWRTRGALPVQINCCVEARRALGKERSEVLVRLDEGLGSATAVARLVVSTLRLNRVEAMDAKQRDTDRLVPRDLLADRLLARPVFGRTRTRRGTVGRRMPLETQQAGGVTSRFRPNVARQAKEVAAPERASHAPLPSGCF